MCGEGSYYADIFFHTGLSEQTEVFLRAGIEEGRYLWSEDLLQWRGSGGEVYVLPQQVLSPLSTKHEEWLRALQVHPDRDFVEYILNGIAAGFEIGFERKVQLVGARHNLPSAEAHGKRRQRQVG